LIFPSPPGKKSAIFPEETGECFGFAEKQNGNALASDIFLKPACTAAEPWKSSFESPLVLQPAQAWEKGPGS
jgi:hypothetical protein